MVLRPLLGRPVEADRFFERGDQGLHLVRLAQPVGPARAEVPDVDPGVPPFFAVIVGRRIGQDRLGREEVLLLLGAPGPRPACHASEQGFESCSPCTLTRRETLARASA